MRETKMIEKFQFSLMSPQFFAERVTVTNMLSTEEQLSVYKTFCVNHPRRTGLSRKADNYEETCQQSRKSFDYLFSPKYVKKVFFNCVYSFLCARAENLVWIVWALRHVITVVSG